MSQVSYFVFDDEGTVIKRGTCHQDTLSDHAKEGQTVMMGDCPSDHDVDLETGLFVTRQPSPAVEPSYREKRAAHYPPIVDQLDALWHGMNDGVLPKVDAFYEPIAAVKEEYPKT